METLGHSQITLTMNNYAHVLPAVEREALDQAAQALFEDGSKVLRLHFLAVRPSHRRTAAAFPLVRVRGPCGLEPTRALLHHQ